MLLKDLEIKWDIKISGIYQIQNKINNKIYIGSAIDIYNRLHKHVSDLKKNKHHSIHLQRAWNKYGENNFDFNIVENVDNKELLIEREQYWFDILKPYKKQIGYNISKIAGSQLGLTRDNRSKEKNRQSQKNHKPILQIDLNNNIINEWYGANEISKKENIDRNLLLESIKNKKIFNNFIWMYTEDYNLNINFDAYFINDIHKKITKLSNSIIQLDLQGNYIKEWNSVKEINDCLNIHKSNIYRCCNFKRKQAKGYIWMYSDYYYNKKII